MSKNKSPDGQPNTALPTRQVRRIATFPEQTEMYRLCLENSSPVDGDEKNRVWHEGWGFALLASKVSPTLERGHAIRVAESMGVTISRPQPADSSPEQARTAVLEQHIRAVDTRLSALEPRVDDLNNRLAGQSVRDLASQIHTLRDRVDYLVDAVGQLQAFKIELEG